MHVCINIFLNDALRITLKPFDACHKCNSLTGLTAAQYSISPRKKNVNIYLRLYRYRRDKIAIFCVYVSVAVVN